MKSIPFIFSGLWLAASCLTAEIPQDYQGQPYHDDVYQSGPQLIPGRVELAYFDMGGEGIAYHDTDSSNNGSGVLNRDPLHERPGVSERILHFREHEGVDISFTKDFADFNHTNQVDPAVNQLYIGWQEDGEWTNYTIDICEAGRYRIQTIYGNHDNRSELWLDGEFATRLVLPEDTGNWHYWNGARVGEIEFSEPGLHLLTLKYNSGANLAFLDFVLIQPEKQ